MDPVLFAADLAEKPARLEALAAAMRDGDPWVGVDDESTSWVFLGMGSSHYANQVAAARLRARGIPAVAELAASDLLPVVDPRTTVVAVSASGGSAETLDAVRRLRAAGGGARFVALTNGVSTGSTRDGGSDGGVSTGSTHDGGSDRDGGSTRDGGSDGGVSTGSTRDGGSDRDGGTLVELCDDAVDLRAGVERGGVACRSFQHTLALLLALESHLTGAPETAALLDRAAEASAHVLDSRLDWLPAVSSAALGPHGTHVVAPARRLSSALQSALMLREGPRLPAVGCETADWSHVDVYLTKTTDYRLVLLAGSRWEPELLDWVNTRGSTLVAVGGEVRGADVTVRYPHDDHDDVRLLTETLVLELVAAEAWSVSST